MSSDSLKDIVLAFKTIHLLVDVVEDRTTGRTVKKASHYCTVLVQGKQPLWGVWTIGGKFLRFAGSRAQIEKAYPGKIWDKKLAGWNLAEDIDVDVQNVDKRIAFLENKFGEKPKRGKAPPKAKPDSSRSNIVPISHGRKKATA